MTRYVTRRPRAAYIESPDVNRWRPWMEESTHLPNLEVDGPRDGHTGLVDAHGNDIWRVADPLGFHNPKDGR